MTSSEADEAGLEALVERLLAERRRDLRLADQLQVDRQGADLQEGRQVLGLAGCVKPPEIWAPVRPSIPSGFSAKLMIGRGLDFVVEDDREVAGERSAASCRRADRLRLAALGDLPGDVLERVPALSVKSKVTFGWLFWSKFCSGLVMSSPAERRFVLERRTSPGRRRRALPRSSAGPRDDDRALRDR